MFSYYLLQFSPPVIGKVIGNDNSKKVSKIIIFSFFARCKMKLK